MRFVNKRLSKRILSEKNIPLNMLESYALVSHLGKYSLISRDIEKVDMKDFNLVSIGLPIGSLSE
ncbi:MAG TPA: hypothetical protein VJC07_02965 [Candidatus Nanoarchaeia archaeon]|nr:hypothetical protein [Candidatus Nanoarchaeia archaeon]